MRKTFLYLLIGFFVLLAGFFLLIWLAIRNTSENWSTKEEYAALIGKTFYTTDTVFLTRQGEHEFQGEI